MDIKRTGRTKIDFNKLFQYFVRWRLVNDKLKNFPKMDSKLN